MSETVKPSKAEIREELAKIIVKASARGNGRAVGMPEARVMVNNLVASDDAREWSECRVGRDVLSQVVNGYLR